MEYMQVFKKHIYLYSCKFYLTVDWTVVFQRQRFI